MIVEIQQKFLQRSEFHEERRPFALAPFVDIRLKKLVVGNAERRVCAIKKIIGCS